MSAPTLPQLAWTVARHVNGTLGGGVASMELLRRTFTRQGWLDARGHALIIAASRLTPGTTVLAYCVGLGWRYFRWVGSLLALGVSSVPVAVMVGALMATLVRVEDYPVVRIIQAAGVLVATTMILITAWQLIVPFLTWAQRWRALVLIGLTVALIALDMSPIRIMLAVALMSASLPVAWSDAVHEGESSSR